MASTAAQACYRLRSLHERINADPRRRGLIRPTVRRKAKVHNVLLRHTLAHNLLRSLSLRLAALAA